ncbi:dienelactone hydrolase family protein [Flavobacterium sp. GT3R68]|uniref:dienelactone hydrolase family protein n=1 Tax=Flavobacterium sp. GT3R68 TaxID=2594437 RepID=UPI000F8743AC|nr:dienelactone hydrolase family protein [Flavobacterium sp. GT3R68]RTY95142.1 dienelactone hydrolase family protein [Flavobacterium sp. GSN2]TRW91116.1 dienelactone hydrolase family protein [Flavobacterium sp. GT3R68]
MKNTSILFCLMMVTFSGFSQLKPIQYKDDQQILNGFQILPKKANKDKPGILILPAWKGIDNHSKTSAKQLSDLGYYTFIADIYGEGNYPKDAKEAGQQAGLYKNNPVQYQKRIRLALEQLIKAGANPDKIVIIGYCFGGTGALEAARGKLPVKAVVSFHGGLGKDISRPTDNIDARVLVCHGADDPYVTKEEITTFQQEMRDAKTDWQMIYYSNAVHAFTDPEAGNDNSKGAAYNAKAASRSWKHFLIFLKEVL